MTASWESYQSLRRARPDMAAGHLAYILIFIPREALINLVGRPRPWQASSGEALVRLSARLGSRVDY